MTDDSTKHDVRMLFLLPPTEAQYQTQEPMILALQDISKRIGSVVVG
jgi:hypothetical protein